MTGTTATSDGREPPASRRPLVPRVVAAFFLGAGVYAGLAVTSAVVAHADETAATSTQAAAAPADATTPAETTTTTDQSSAATEPEADATSTTTAATTDTPTTSADPTAAPSADPVATTAPDAGAAPVPAATTPTTTTTSDGPTTTTTVTTTPGSVSTVDATPIPTSTEAVAASSVVPTTAALPGPVAGAAVSAACQPTGITVASATRAGGSATRNRPTGSYAMTVPTNQPATPPASSVVDAAAAPALIHASAGQAPASSPLAPQGPAELPVSASAAGLVGCGGPGAGEGSPKGATTPATTGVLASPFEISLAVTGAASEAPAAGSPTLTATDPATRPD